MRVHIVIGKNFGDEGKGLAVDYFSLQAKKRDASCIVLRHNGGAQAGHTVNLPDKSFSFHQLSSGSFRYADTFWTQTFMPDLYKLSEELQAFESVSGIRSKIYTSAKCRCVVIDDVLMNMAVETARGSRRHGSCGMGINEAVRRSEHPEFNLSVQTVKCFSADALTKKLMEIRYEYLPKKLMEYNLSLEQMGEYGELLQNKNVLRNAAEEMCRCAQKVEIINDSFVGNYDEVIFEGAQGLLLDENYLSFAPHLTSSHTGLHNPIAFCKENLSKASVEAIYVTRAYVTKHGAGPLPNEASLRFSESLYSDQTNIPNPWQGTLRYALHGTPEDFLSAVHDDVQKTDYDIRRGLMITHLNETNQMIYSTDGMIPWEQWIQNEYISNTFQEFLISDTPYSKDITSITGK